MSILKHRPSLWAALLALSCAAPASVLAAPWQTIAQEAGSRVELDAGRISRLKNGKTAAWTRLTLDHPVLDFENRLRYTAVLALNHYDCAQGSFATQKRIYLLDGREIRAEAAAAREQFVVPDSLDARLLEAVCRPRTVGELHETAARVAELARALAEAPRPRPMRAELVSAGEAAAPRAMKVADAAPSEKPRFIELPVIDKSKAEDPYKNLPPPAPPAAAKPAAAPVAAPAAAAKVPPPPVIIQEPSRQQRELMLATSGPRKAVKKKSEESAPPAPDFSHVHWGYTGLGGPENWHKLRPDYALCATGKRQSPIDIRGGIKVDLEPIQFDYKPSQFRIVDNGHTVQVEVGEGNSITVMGRTYPLVQFHFHRPSEERINGKAYDMVIHFVHKDYDNSLAVVAVLLEKGAEHPVIQTLWNHMPLEVGMEVAPPGVLIDLARLLPEKREYFTYMGSLTTPPCTENVLWMVFKQPVQVSPEQIAIFARLYPYNARPVQPTNDRLIKGSR
ncbi:MAG: carbonic anhydrase family protein [Rhodocyclaceae bacterium]|nr:carbonic anhydrase family protein [Rhodocyclaceae bacterium]